MRDWGTILLLAVAGLLGAGSVPAGAQSAAGEPAFVHKAVAVDGGTRVLIAPPKAFTETCLRYAWLCANTAPVAERQITPAQELSLAQRVNRHVNYTVTQLSDAENYGVADYWTLPTNGRGDCEDFVLEKYKLLLDAGVDAQDLAVAIVLDRHGDNHAVLVLRHSSGDLVLDSLSSRILPWNQTGYTFIAMQTSADKRAWEVVVNQPKASSVLAQR